MPLSSDDFEHFNRGTKPVDHDALHSVNTEGMPTFARLRLQEHIKNPRAPFTSNLSVNEFLLTRGLGYKPVAQVIGASVYHVGWNWLPNSYFGSAMEMKGLTEARWNAWAYAVGRLEQQARAAGADSIVGVTMNQRHFDSNFQEKSAESGDVIEIFLTGTAVRFQGQITNEKPLLSTFSAQEFTALVAAGYYPLGVAYGCVVTYQPSYWSAMMGTTTTVAPGTQWQNQEQTDYTHGLIDARRLAEQRLYDQAQILGASGLLDVRIESNLREVEHDVNERKQVGVIITFEAYGTAVVRIDKDAKPIVIPMVSLGE